MQLLLKIFEHEYHYQERNVYGRTEEKVRVYDAPFLCIEADRDVALAQVRVTIDDLRLRNAAPIDERNKKRYLFWKEPTSHTHIGGLKAGEVRKLAEVMDIGELDVGSIFGTIRADGEVLFRGMLMFPQDVQPKDPS